MQNKDKHALVLGGGFGGMAAALRLKALGYSVSLVDRLKQLGGRAQVYSQKGYTFDAGPTVITAPHLFEELFELFGKKLSDYVHLEPLKIWYQYVFHDKRSLNYGQDLQQTLQQIQTFSPQDVQGYLRLVDFSEKIFNVGFDHLAQQPFNTVSSMLKIIPDLIRLKSYKNVYQFVSSFIHDESLRRAFSISPLLVGGNPFDTSSIYSLIHFLERKWGVWYPSGGTGALVTALQTLMLEQGIEVHLNTHINQIALENKTATGVYTEGGHFFPADLVIANADPAHVYKHLLASDKRKVWTDRKVDRLQYSMGLFVLYFGTNKQYPNVQHHTIVLGKTFKTLLSEIFHTKRLCEDLSLYVHRPTATDSSLAPDGCESFYVLAPVPNLKGSVDWQEAGPILQNKILEILQEQLLPDLKKHLDVCFYVTPKTFAERFQAEWGAGFSIAPTLRQSAYFRFHNQSEEFQSLYFVGAGTHPGAGVPGVLCSAKVLEKLLMKSEE